MHYPVHETFHSWQGEGSHLGRSAWFIRLFGCPVKCPWCDSAGTWHPEYIPERIERRTVDALAAEAVAAQPEFVVITGGEPTIHDLAPLARALAQSKLRVHLETSGAFPISGHFDWITLSPKWARPALPENISLANELKIIVEAPASLESWDKELALRELPQTVWLHPEWSQRDNPDVLNAITEWVKAHGAPFRAGWQLHKCYRADTLDPASRPENSLAR